MRRAATLAFAFSLLTACGPSPEPGAAPDSAPVRPAERVLIITDEADHMAPLAEFLKEKGGIESTILDYPALPEAKRRLPEDMSGYDALVGYIHNDLNEPTERGIIDYTEGGGRFVCLHHMISSGKAKNAHYFDFLGVHMDDIELAREPAEPGAHYMWREPVEKTVVNMAPDHYITSHGITWQEGMPFKPTDVPDMEVDYYPAATLQRTEVYVNVKRTDGDAKTLLLGYIYNDDRNGVTHAQATDGWIKPAGEGWIVYLQPGHFVEEFSDPDGIIDPLVLNAITWRP